MKFTPMRIPKKAEVEAFLLKLGIRPNQRGFDQLAEAIRLWCEQVTPDCIVPQVTKTIYPIICCHYSTSAWAVDANLRHALHNLSEESSEESVVELLRAAPRKDGRYTPSEFIALAALALQDPFVPAFVA